jgi:hypothetical protein
VLLGSGLRYEGPPLMEFKPMIGHIDTLWFGFSGKLVVGSTNDGGKIFFGYHYDFGDSSGGMGIFFGNTVEETQFLLWQGVENHEQRPICLWGKDPHGDWSEFCILDPKNSFGYYENRNFIFKNIKF